MQDREDFVLDASEAGKPSSDRLLPTDFDARNIRLWKVEGEPGILVIEHLPTEASDELEALYISLAQHYCDAWKQNRCRS